MPDLRGGTAHMPERKPKTIHPGGTEIRNTYLQNTHLIGKTMNKTTSNKNAARTRRV
jgi:hypothetical protein